MANRKVLVGLGSIAAACLLLGIFVVGPWWDGKRKELQAMGEQTGKEAAAFAKTHEENACVKEGLAKTKKCDGIMCRARATAFVTECLKLAKPTPGFCKGVPKQTEILAVATWSVEYCDKHAPNIQQECARMMGNSVAKYCEHPVKKENGGAKTAPPKAKKKPKQP